MWKSRINNVTIKLKKINAILFKIRRYVDITLKSIYYAMFESHLMPHWFGCKLGAKRLHILQKQLFRLIFFKVEMLRQVLFSFNI